MPKEKGLNISPVEVNIVQKSLSNLLESDPSYALVPDPTGKMGLTNDEKLFIANYVQCHNVLYAGTLSCLSPEEAMKIYNSWNVKSEISRICVALSHKRSLRESLSIDEIAGIVSSLIMDENVAESDRLSSKDKITAAKTLLEVLKMKADALNNNIEVVDYEEVKDDISSLNTNQLKELIAKMKGDTSKDAKKSKKEEIIRELTDSQPMEPSELAVLYGMSVEELTILKNEVKGSVKDDGEDEKKKDNHKNKNK